MLRVAIDTYALDIGQSGSARYVRGLLAGLRELAPPDLEFFEFGLRLPHASFRQPQRALRTFYREMIWARALAPRLIAGRQADIFHSTSVCYIDPPRRVRHVATLFDLALLRHPERFRPWHRASGRRRLLKLQGADQVLCISQFTANEAAALLGLAREKLTVTLLASTLDPDPRAEAKPAFDVPDEFFLFVGSLEPGKNLSLLRRVYEMAANQRPFPPLLIVGTRWRGVGTEGPPPAGWTYLGNIPDAELAYLYRRARALVFPSKYEGFGLPPLEAMSLGCPVICSRVASLPEVVGDAALFAELTPESYQHALAQLLDDDDLRHALSARGRVQASTFSWKKCAAETAGVYRSLQ